MYAPDKVAMIFVKFFVAMFLFSLITSLANIVPYYMQLNHAANDLLLRGAVNNYILESQVDDIVGKTFVDNPVFSSLTYTGGRENSRGVHVYAKTSEEPKELFRKGACNLGEYCPEYASTGSSGRVIIPESAGTWDPKTKTEDTIKFRTVYNGAQRGDSITVRLEAKVNCIVLAMGIERKFQIPLAVEKSGPAMHYFRI